MSNKTRKYAWPVSVAMAFAIVATLAAFIVLASTPDAAIAHNPGSDHTDSCADSLDLIAHDSVAERENQTNADGGQHSCDNPGTDVVEPQPDPEDVLPNPMDMITSDSTSASGSPEIQLELVDIGMALDVGASIVLYLEDDFAEPDSIPASSVYLRVTDPRDNTTGNAGRVYVESAPKIKTSDYFDQDKNDISIRVLVPDLCDDDTAGCEGQDGIPAGADVTLVIESDSGIKNPSEARKPGYHTGYVLLDASAANSTCSVTWRSGPRSAFPMWITSAAMR